MTAPARENNAERAWWSDAACRAPGIDPAIFFPERAEDVGGTG